MLVLYNILLTTALIVVGPLLAVKAICTAKYRRRLPQRLGRGVAGAVAACHRPGPRIWLHALSVGEVASARALVQALRVARPEATLILSTTTSAGADYAAVNLAGQVDLLLAFPLDLRPCVAHFLDQVRPDLFVQVETDFWPNFLAGLRSRGIPAVLVNGRISSRSFDGYRRARLFFRPLFDSFTQLAMQTGEDVARMVALGIPAAKVTALGNLKYESASPGRTAATVSPATYGLDVAALLWVAGSTHDGEHEMALRVQRRLRGEFPHLLLVLAPRQVDRGRQLAARAAELGLTVARRSQGGRAAGQAVLIGDTIGELADLYRFCAVAFVGGSLVAAGGHNPLEPAVFAKPVLFGPHMEDFREVSRDLVAAGGAAEVADEEALYQQLRALLADHDAQLRMGERGAAFVARQQGVTERHLVLVLRLLDQSAGGGISDERRS